jgi:hypothetical protein
MNEAECARWNASVEKAKGEHGPLFALALRLVRFTEDLPAPASWLFFKWLPKRISSLRDCWPWMLTADPAIYPPAFTFRKRRANKRPQDGGDITHVTDWFAALAFGTASAFPTPWYGRTFLYETAWLTDR